MTADATDHEVVVVGAGPIGLMTAIELGRRGIDVHIVERRTTRLGHPRAIGIHARTMEIFRQLGWADEVRQKGNLPIPPWSTFGYATRLNASDLGAIDLMSSPARLERAAQESPEFIAWCAQDVFEPLLAEKCRELDSVTLTTGVTVTGILELDDRVVVNVLDESGSQRQISAKYLVGADGARSTVRQLLSIDAPTATTKGYQLNACFTGDLSKYLHGRKHILWWIINKDIQGAFLTYDGDRRWVFSWAYDPSRETIADYPFERCAEVIRSAIGDNYADISVEAVFPWTIDASIAERFRHGRCFLAGDAAHRIPPSGGFGMNSGLQDAQNLGWKLALVLRSQASDALLDTYEQERRAVSLYNAEVIYTLVDASAKAGWIMNDPDTVARIEEPDGEAARARIRDAIPLQEDQYWSYGQQFGFIYESSAVVPDNTEAPVSTIGDYRPTAAPGAHAPHVWLRDNSGNRVSTIDLAHTRFVLLTTPSGTEWARALRDVAGRRGVEAVAYILGDGGDYQSCEVVDWTQRYGITAMGAVLIRPDGHVAFRAADRDHAPADALDAVFRQLLSPPVAHLSS